MASRPDWLWSTHKKGRAMPGRSPASTCPELHPALALRTQRYRPAQPAASPSALQLLDSIPQEEIPGDPSAEVLPVRLSKARDP